MALRQVAGAAGEQGEAILKLHKQVQTSTLGAHRREQVEQLEAEALNALPTSEMKGLLR